MHSTTADKHPSTTEKEIDARDRDAGSDSDLESSSVFKEELHKRQDHWTGLRGLLVIQSFLWTYFITFIPAIVSSETSGPAYQSIIRATLSVLFWNESFIHNCFIILSMRVVAIGFLNEPTGPSYASAVIRRIVRLVIAVSFAAGISDLILTQIGIEYIDNFRVKSSNNSIRTPVRPYDALAVFNSLFDFFWLKDDFYKQAANRFWPSGTLWVTSVIYYQSFTVFFLMVILPFTRKSWHAQLLFLFGLGSFWMESWGWYSATGLLFANIAVTPALLSEFRAGYKFNQHLRMPYWAVAIILATAGLALKYVFTIFPQYQNSELVLHPYLDLSGSINAAQFAGAGPYPRIDDWMIIMSILIMTESFEYIQKLLSSTFLVGLGERSFSIFTSQCVILWTVGIKIWLALKARNDWSTASCNIIVLLACLPVIAITSEIGYRLVDQPSRWISQHAYTWLTT